MNEFIRDNPFAFFDSCHLYGMRMILLFLPWVKLYPDIHSPDLYQSSVTLFLNEAPETESHFDWTGLHDKREYRHPSMAIYCCC